MQKFICQYPADIRFHENVLIEATGLLGARIGECDIRPYMSSWNFVTMTLHTRN